ncbi:MAG: periplasmic heavy metal sensor [bacterium]|nr:MAG: periplasmic heavy metal sensor [bacterium]
MKRSIVIAVALVALLVPGMLLAQGKSASETTCKKAPELSEEQLAKLEELKVDHKLANIKLEAELKVLKIQMERELKKYDASARELESLVSKIAAVKEKILKSRIDHLLQVRKVLKPEQWKHMSKCCGGMGGCCSMGKGCGGSCCGGKGGCCSMGKCCGGSCCGGKGGCCSMGMGHGKGCCGGQGAHSIMMGGHGCSGLHSMDKHIFVGKGGSCPCCGGKMGGIHWEAESCHPEGMKVIKQMKGCAGGEGEGKEIKRKCIKVESGK